MRFVDAMLERDGRRARYVLIPFVSSLGTVLPAMGFPEEGGRYIRELPDSDDMPRLFGNFRASIDEMIAHKRRDRPAPWESALAAVVGRLSSGVDWSLVGSAGLAVRGVAVAPRDIDLVVDDALRTGELLDDVLIEPVRRMGGWVAEWHGRAFEEALIEWVAGVHGGTEPPQPVDWRGYRMRCSSLETELRVAAARGLTDRVRAIRRHMCGRS
jgi:hypothetical protein